MRITCPFCHSAARLSPNPAHAEHHALPIYVLACSGCDRTNVRREPTHQPRQVLAVR